MRVVWSPLAVERVRNIAHEIAADRPTVARRWVRGIFARVHQLRQHPLSGRIAPDLERPEVRQLPHSPCRIVYRVERSHVFILTVRYDREEDLDRTTEL
jgi:toxin ParE1/3/4